MEFTKPLAIDKIIEAPEGPIVMACHKARLTWNPVILDLGRTRRGSVSNPLLSVPDWDGSEGKRA